MRFWSRQLKGSLEGNPCQCDCKELAEIDRDDDFWRTFTHTPKPPTPKEQISKPARRSKLVCTLLVPQRTPEERELLAKNRGVNFKSLVQHYKCTSGRALICSIRFSSFTACSRRLPKWAPTRVQRRKRVSSHQRCDRLKKRKEIFIYFLLAVPHAETGHFCISRYRSNIYRFHPTSPLI